MVRSAGSGQLFAVGSRLVECERSQVGVEARDPNGEQQKGRREDDRRVGALLEAPSLRLCSIKDAEADPGETSVEDLRDQCVVGSVWRAVCCDECVVGRVWGQFLQSARCRLPNCNVVCYRVLQSTTEDCIVAPT